MFTGIVDHCGRIAESRDGGRRLHVATRFSELVLGESISVDGCCLTVTSTTAEGFWCDLSPETLRLTRAGGYRAGDRVNLERAMRLGDRLGGHLVTGHVDRTVTLQSREETGGFLRLVFGPFSREDRVYLLKKGSLAVNGVSLTLNEVAAEAVEVMLIPHTRELTNLGALAPGDRVNVEFDWMVKVILNREANR